MSICRTKGDGLDATAELYGLARKRYFWGLFVETDRRLWRRVMRRLEALRTVNR